MGKTDSPLVTQIKSAAKRIKSTLKTRYEIEINFTQALEVAASAYGFKNWNVAAASGGHAIRDIILAAREFSSSYGDGEFLGGLFGDKENPVVLLTGLTGSGKSVQAVLMLEKILGYSHVSKKASRLFNQKVRYADVGFNGGNLVKALVEAHGKDVELFSDNIHEAQHMVRFGLFDFDLLPNGSIPDEERRFLTDFISFVLEMSGAEPLNGMERSIFEESVLKMLNSDGQNEMLVEDLSGAGGYQRLVDEIVGGGFDIKTKIKDLPDEYDFLKRPVLSQLLKIISIDGGNINLFEHNKKAYSSLLMKIKTIDANPIFNMLSNIKAPNDKQFYYVDFDSVKYSAPLFNTYWMMFMRIWLRELREGALSRSSKGAASKTVFFFVEEAHNLLGYKSFETVLGTVTEELQKYDGRLLLVSQDIGNLPDKISSLVSTVVRAAPMSKTQQNKEKSRLLSISSQNGTHDYEMVMEGEPSFYMPTKIS